MPAKSDLLRLSATEMRKLVGSRRLSPVELMTACIAQIERWNGTVNAIAATDFERALSQSRRAEMAVMRGQSLGPLHGLPLGVKDVQDTKGLLTTYGNVQFRSHVPEEDSALVSRLRLAGAIVTAKTNVPDMGAGANTRNSVWGATGNPFNPALNAGGSSGGSAAALACDMLPVCTGSDMGGSLRIPAALCGVVGFRPSPGLIANDVRTLGWSVLSVLGPMSRNVEDTALLLSACVGPHHLDPLSYSVSSGEFWPIRPVDLSTLRVGFTEDFGLCPVSDEIRRVFRSRVAALAPLVAVCAPATFNLKDADRVFDILRAETFFASHAKAQKETLGPNVRENLEMFLDISLSDVVWARIQQTSVARKFAEVFKEFDIIVAPTSPVSPFPWKELYAKEIKGQSMENYYRWTALTYLVTLATNPAVSLPCGTDEDGMPFGLQVIGPLRRDGALLRASLALEQIFDRALPVLTQIEGLKVDLKSIATHPPGGVSG